MSRALRKYDPYELRTKQERYYRGAVYDEQPMEKSEMTSTPKGLLNAGKTRLTQKPMAAEAAQEELDFDQPILGESKNERFKRVANFRLTKAIERLRMLRQMFEGSTVNNYEFTEQQMHKLVTALNDEVNEINRLMAKRLSGRNGDIPQL